MPAIDTIDPRGLIRESYRIDGISEGECRSIFLDWAISVPADVNSADNIRVLLDAYARDNPAHPMTKVLTEALTPAPRTGRRGGAAGRRV